MPPTTTKLKSAKPLEIPALRLSTLSIELVGQTPLITNAFSEEALDVIEDKQGGKAREGRKPRVPEECYRQAHHWIDEAAGVAGFPSSGVFKAVVAAGGRFAGEKMTVLRGAFVVNRPLLEIKSGPSKRRRDFVRLRDGTASLAYRPEFWPWSLVVPVTFNESIISRDQLVNLMRLAGQSVGIGCWRPETSGSFGLFDIGQLFELR